MTTKDLKPIPWKPGQSGNPAGRPKNKPITAALKDLLDKNDGEAIKALASVALKNALKGDFRYAKEILDRIDGKVMDQLDVTTDGQAIADYPGLNATQRNKLADMEDGPEECA